LNLKANLASPTFTGTIGGISKAMVGLGNADMPTAQSLGSTAGSAENKFFVTWYFTINSFY
jgi:hypothetical protein